VENKQEAEAGFKKDAYCVSKAFVVALTKGLAAENTGLQINW
jgi:short-subunit dehydrogenase